jgi:hypothetical protein
LDKNLTYESFCSYGSIGDYGWISFYDFFTKVGVINHEGFNQFKEILLSGVYDMIQLEGFCIMSEMPKELKRNANNDLHCIDAPAIIFKDGYCQYYVNGRTIPENYFHSISNKTYKMEDFINESNEEHKSTCIALMQEKFGDEYLVEFFRQNLTEVDTFVNKKEDKFLVGTTRGMNVGVYTLFKGEINGVKIAYCRCYCPSTDRMFFLGVDSKYNTAKDAIASLCMLPKKMIPHLKELKRQGERLSSTYTDEGWKLYKTLSEKDISDLEHLTGDVYFSKMTYEF